MVFVYAYVCVGLGWGIAEVWRYWYLFDRWYMVPISLFCSVILWPLEVVIYLLA